MSARKYVVAETCRRCGGTGREPAPISRGSYACSVCLGSGTQPPVSEGER